jgi:hypothetical protein
MSRLEADDASFQAGRMVVVVEWRRQIKVGGFRN